MNHGNIVPREYRIGLAPMEGVTNFPFRLWMNLVSQPTFQGTPFLRVTPTYPCGMPSQWAPELFIKGLSESLSYELMPQLMSPDEKNFLKVAQKLLSYTSHLEINCGCPAPTVVGKGAGSGLLKKIDHFVSFIEACVNELQPKVLAVKMRTGFYNDDLFCDLVSGIAHLPLKRITVHARTREQKYRGKANWDLIGKAASIARCPVFASGDITNGSILKEKFLKYPAISGAIVGRGALRNPWVFAEIREGKSQAISFGVLQDSLISYALLNELFISQKDVLFDLCGKFSLNDSLGQDPGKWSELREVLLKSLKLDYSQLSISSQSLGRAKLLWNYMRTSLPQEFFEPKILRSKSIKEFMTRLAAQHRSYQEMTFSDEIKLQWQDRYDWMFSGESKQSPP